MNFNGQVVVVTGAGGGLGRDYALEFGRRGASVVVNDLGGSRSGDKGDSRMADLVVNEIRAAGGKAVANYDSVENGEAVIKTAIDNYGRIDVVVNNAGILRDKSFANMTQMDWDLIHRVHLKGSWAVSKAAWPYMKKQKYGRIIMTSSNSGVYGNFGQANYSAAKMGLIGLSNTMAIEGEKYNIFVNSYIPTAGSRLTEDVMPPEMFAALRTDYSVPLVLFLSHADCSDTGGLFEAAAGWFGQLQWYRSNGVSFGKNGATLEQVRDHWERIKDMTDSRHYGSSGEVSMDLINKMENINASTGPAKQTSGKKSNTKPELAKAHKFEPMENTYTAKDTILYAIGVGAETGTDMRYLYENDDNFSALPTLSVVFGLPAMAGLGTAPGIHVDFSRLLHGEQYLEVYRSFPTEGKIISEVNIADVLDKGSGAAVLTNVTQRDAVTGEKLAFAQYSTFLRGEGNFDGARNSKHEKLCVPVPKRKPDVEYEQRIPVDQAALYRQASGDPNPIHIDNDFAKMSGFNGVILHGLCSLGFAVRHVIKCCADNDASRFHAVKARFSKPVTPGHTLVTQMWKEGKRVHFQAMVKETGDIAISGAYVDFNTAPGASSAAASASSGGGGESELGSQMVFDELANRMKANPDIVKKVNAVYQWVIMKNGKEAARYVMDMKTPGGAVYQGEPKSGKPGVTLTLEDDNMIKLVSGEMNPQKAFMTGKLKLKGNIMLTQKLQTLLKEQSKV